MTAKYQTPEQWATDRQQPLESVYRQIRQGRIRAVNVGHKRQPRYRIPASEVNRYDRDNSAA